MFSVHLTWSHNNSNLISYNVKIIVKLHEMIVIERRYAWIQRIVINNIIQKRLMFLII